MRLIFFGTATWKGWNDSRFTRLAGILPLHFVSETRTVGKRRKEKALKINAFEWWHGGVWAVQYRENDPALLSRHGLPETTFAFHYENRPYLLLHRNG
ncbi:MAG TPA: hypothetical protein VGE29_17670 [Prosthecobacter sp.]